jgi:hypothetical protein
MAENHSTEKKQQVPTKIRSKKLTTCHVASDGTNVGLGFLDGSGTPVTVELPLDQAEAVVMTLPHLLARAVKQQTGDEDARYVFGLRGWSIEKASEPDCLIVTLKTTNGFEACFGIPLEACKSLGWVLQCNADVTVEASEIDNVAIAPQRDKLN